MAADIFLFLEIQNPAEMPEWPPAAQPTSLQFASQLGLSRLICVLHAQSVTQ